MRQAEVLVSSSHEGLPCRGRSVVRQRPELLGWRKPPPRRSARELLRRQDGSTHPPIGGRIQLLRRGSFRKSSESFSRGNRARIRHAQVMSTNRPRALHHMTDLNI